jgi:hypothetical protein
MNYPCREIDELNISSRKNPALLTHRYRYRRFSGLAQCQDVTEKAIARASYDVTPVDDKAGHYYNCNGKAS